jgi:hypothetical protein
MAVLPEVEAHQAGLHKAQARKVSWMTFSVADPDLESERFLVTYCTDCLAREFGGVLCWMPAARTA